MIKALGKYLRDKLGITALSQGLTARLEFLSSYAQLVVPDHIQLDSVVLELSRKEIAARYHISTFKDVIHKNDIMFQHHLRKMPGRPAEAVWHYFNVGLDALSKVRDNVKGEVNTVLDFGAGYGRGSRFINKFFPEAGVTVSEIKPQAMAFQKEAFGFNTIIHGPDPESFEGGTFDLIMAISVFSHLPEPLSKSWIGKLTGSLNDGGMILFTFNGIRYASAGRGDYQFIEQSEDQGMKWVSDRLVNQNNYGSAFYSENRIKDLVKDIPGISVEVIENFSGQQDALIVRK